MSTRALDKRPKTDETIAFIHLLRHALVLKHPKPIPLRHIAMALGFDNAKFEQNILTAMDDVWEEDGKIGLTEWAAAKYEEILERKYP